MLPYRSVAGDKDGGADPPAGASEEMARPRPPATRNSAPPRGTNNMRAAPRANITPDTVFALSRRRGNWLAGGGSDHAAVTPPASGRGNERTGETGEGSAESCMPDLRASSTVWMRNQGLERRRHHR
jgi:hypothetical protein